MNSRTLRRLAADHGALHSQPLPPNYFFPASANDADDLTQLDIMLAGPTHTPFAAGVFKLHLNIPASYPQAPPTAHFRTPIFHPNVDPQSGGVCVETLKRDWDVKLTLRDILLVVGCLLIQPNPDSALNADAGRLIQEDYAAYTRRAELMTKIHAAVPATMREAVREAQTRGQEIAVAEDGGEDGVDVHDFAEPTAPPRRRRLGPSARQRGTVRSRTSEGSPTGGLMSRSRLQPEPKQPFALQPALDDVFGSTPSAAPPTTEPTIFEDDSSVIMDDNQENDATKSPSKPSTPRSATTPRRPAGTAIPLGELTMDDASSDSSPELEPEYPPSPRKSPSKSPRKAPPPQQVLRSSAIFDRPESSRDAASRGRNITPQNIFDKPLAADSPFVSTFDETPSPRKLRTLRNITPTKPVIKPGGLFGFLKPKTPGRVMKPRSPNSSEKRRLAKERKAEWEAKLWRLCGGDVRRWNRGDFDENPMAKKAARW